MREKILKIQENLIIDLIKDLPELEVKLPKDKIMLNYVVERLNNDLTYFSEKLISTLIKSLPEERKNPDCRSRKLIQCGFNEYRSEVINLLRGN